MSKRALWCFLVSVFFHTGLSAQSATGILHTAYTGTGAYSRTHTDLFSATANQASLTGLKNPAAGMYGERKFLLKELSAYEIMAALPTRSGNFGVNATYQGNEGYNLMKAGLAYARSLGSKVDIGAQFNYSAISISSGYGRSQAVSFEAGGLFHFSEKLHAGIHAANPAGNWLGKNKEERLPAVYSFGFGYEASEKFYCSATTVKEENSPVNINVCIQYKLIPSLLVRAGMSTSASMAWAGAGFTFKSYRLDVVASYHPRLGFTPGLLFISEFKKRQ